MQNDMHLWCVIDLPFWGRGTTEWWMRFMDGDVFAFGKDICTYGALYRATESHEI